MKLGLRGKFVFALVLVTLAALLLAGLFAHRAIESIRAELGVAYTRDVTLLKTARITAPLMRDLALSLRMADSEPIREWVLDERNPLKRARAMAEAEGYRRQFASHTAFVVSGVSLNYYFNSPNKPFTDQPQYALDPVNKPADRWFPTVLGMDRAYDTNVSSDASLKISNVWINVLMRAGERRIALVGTGVELNQFLDEFVGNPQVGVTPIIINSNGAILAHPDRQRISNHAATQEVPLENQLWGLIDPGPSTRIAREVLAQAAANPGQAEPVKLSLLGHEVLFAASYLPDLRWYVLSVVDLGTAEVLDARQLWEFGLSAAALFLVAALLFAWVVHRLVVRPLFALKNSARELAAGNYALQLPVAGNDEIGELGLAFAAMADKVRQHTEELESTVRERTAELEQANATMAAAGLKIADSISYASRIQQAMLPVQALQRLFGPQHYVWWQPRDVVGGDFHLLHESPAGALLGVVDCAGHSVPGALMTMLGRAALDRAIAEVGPADPARILQATDSALRSMLHLGERAKGAATSMDAGLLFIDATGRRLVFAGARIDLWIACPQSSRRIAGGRRALAEKVAGDYHNVELELDAETTCLLTTDGLLDQNGEADNLSYGRARLESLLCASAQQSLAQFGQALQQSLADYQGTVVQRDDICVLAIRIGGGPATE